MALIHVAEGDDLAEPRGVARIAAALAAAADEAESEGFLRRRGRRRREALLNVPQGQPDRRRQGSRRFEKSTTRN